MITAKQERELALMELEGKKPTFWKITKTWFVEAEDIDEARKKIKGRKTDESIYQRITYQKYKEEMGKICMIKKLKNTNELELIEQRTYFVRSKKLNDDISIHSHLISAKNHYNYLDKYLKKKAQIGMNKKIEIDKKLQKMKGCGKSLLSKPSYVLCGDATYRGEAIGIRAFCDNCRRKFFRGKNEL